MEMIKDKFSMRITNTNNNQYVNIYIEIIIIYKYNLE